MNAKELADVIDWIESVSGDVAMSGQKRAAVIFDEAAERLKAMMPRYRPPQPSDDGKWCFLKQDNAPEEPMQLKFRGGTRWEAWDAEEKKYIPVTGGVLPCERPE